METPRRSTRLAALAANEASVSPASPASLCDPPQEAIQIAGMLWSPAGIPALVEDTANEDRQLCRERRHLVYWEMVAECMQERAQHPVGVMAILGGDLLGEIVEPDVGLLDAAVDDVYVRRAHRAGLPSRDVGSVCLSL